MKVVLTTAARDDLKSIGNRIAEDNPARALSFVEELAAACERIGETPEAWPLVPRYQLFGVRRKAQGNYLIFYRIAKQTVEVLHVLHGARDYEPLLFPD